MLQGLDHPNIARIFEITEDSRLVRFYMEAVSGDNFFSAVSGECATLSEWQVAQLVRQILAGLQHLHSAGLAHEDLQPRNVLASTGSSGQGLRLKLIDFGLARKYLRDSNAPTPSSSLACCHCLAPEQAAGSLSPRATMADPACDIWATGALAYALLSGRWPFEAESVQMLHKKIRTGLWAFLPADVWVVSEQAKSLVSSMLVMQTSRRPSASRMLDHAFLQLNALDKQALQPLARSTQVLQSLRRLGVWCDVGLEVMNAVAVQLSSPQIADFAKHVGNSELCDKGVLTFDSLRRALVLAGITIPGRLFGALQAVDGADSSGFGVEELSSAAKERRKGLEEAVLWSFWSKAVADGSTALRSQLPQILEQGDAALRRIFGPRAMDLDAAVLAPTERVAFDDLLALLRASSGKSSGGRCMWRRPGDLRGLRTELTLRMPPPGAP